MRLFPVSCFVVLFSYWSGQMSAVSFQVFWFDSEVWTTKTLRTRRERSGAPHASLVYNRVVSWVVWKNLCFFVWCFVMTVMSSFWRYLFVGIALMVWQGPGLLAVITVSHAIDCMAMRNASKGSGSPSLPTYKCACRVNVCLQSIYVLKYRLISTLVSEED